MAYSKGLSERLKEDRISQLADPLICHILSYLPVKDIVTTSVLSTRWRSHWLSVPCLDLVPRNPLVSFDDLFSNSDRVSKVKKMIMYRDTFKVIRHYPKVQPLPQFVYMSYLWLTICVSDLIWLPTFLEHCPNLKHLVLVLDNHRNMCKWMMNEICFPPTVPQCLLSSLEFVDIKSSDRGYPAEVMKLASYFIQCSAMLKQLTLHMSGSAYLNVWNNLEKILHIPRRSVNCVLVLA